MRRTACPERERFGVFYEKILIDCFINRIDFCPTCSDYYIVRITATTLNVPEGSRLAIECDCPFLHIQLSPA